MTQTLFRSDAYAQSCDARIVGVTETGGIILDRTVFYASAGGQPGDVGSLDIEGVGAVKIAATVYSPDRAIVHMPAEPLSGLCKPGQAVAATLDWPTRFAHMRMHSALHLLCALVKYQITGAKIGLVQSSVDFDIPEAGGLDKDALTAGLNTLVAADHPISERFISETELDAKPELVRTLSVKPPRGLGQIRLVVIGHNGEIDLQPCGGTHVRSTAQIGPLAVAKIEKKGRLNRRVRVQFA